MPPKRGRPTAAAKGKAPMQQQLEQLPLIKKPLELIGDHVNVPGAFWEGRMSAAEKETLYKCVVRDHSALHKFINGHTSEAFEVQEMGAAGTGSLERGDASGDIFWIAYPFPVPCRLQGTQRACACLACTLYSSVILHTSHMRSTVHSFFVVATRYGLSRAPVRHDDVFMNALS